MLKPYKSLFDYKAFLKMSDHLFHCLILNNLSYKFELFILNILNLYNKKDKI